MDNPVKTPSIDEAPRRQCIFGGPDLMMFLRAFVNYEKDRAYYEYCRDIDGEHGIPAGTYIKAKEPVDALRRYLEIKLEDFLRYPDDHPEFVCSEARPLSEEYRPVLVRFNAWLASGRKP